MSPLSRRARRGASTGLAAVLLVTAASAAWAQEPLPGPPARAGHPPIGGALLTGNHVRYDAGGAKISPPAMDAASWLLADADTGEILAAKGPHLRFRPASTLKTLTALTLMPVLDPKSMYTATSDDARAEGSRVGLVPGSPYSIEQLWYALLLPSANDAAQALANAGGGIPKTVASMNALAQHLQAYDTVAKSPSGLDHNGQWTSAYDMAILGRAALALPEFVKISHTTTYRFPTGVPPSGPRTDYPIYGENRLLNHGYPGIIAGKNGFTTEAKRTFWTAANRNGHTLIVSMFRIVGPTEPAAEALLNWGFRHRSQLRPIGTLVGPAGVPAVTPTNSTSQPSASATDAATSTVRTLVSTPTSSPIGWIILALLGFGAAVLVVWQRMKPRAQGTAPETDHGSDPDDSAATTTHPRRTDALL